MDLQDKCVPSTNNIHVPNKGLFVDISASDDNMQLKELVSSENELPIRLRKPYTITKQRERWTEEEHEKFLEALRLHGRAWRRIQEHIGTKTAIQIRSHAQKFFSKVDRDSGTEKAIEIPPPRPKRKPLHPYPRKLDRLCTTRVPDMKQPEQSSPISSLSDQESGSPVSVLSVVGSDTLGSPVSKPSNSCASPLSPVVRSDPLVLSLSEPENGCCSPASSVVRDDRILSPSQASSTLAKLDDTPMESKLGSRNWFSPIEGSPVGEQPSSLKLFGRTFLVTNAQNPCSSADGNVAQDFKSVPIADVGLHKERADTDMQNQASAFVHLPAHEDLCGTAGRITSDGAAPSMYYFLVPDGIQMNSPDKKISPVPFWQTSYGSLPLPFTEKLYMSSKQDRPQTSTEVTTQAIAGREVSFTGCSLGSAWNESIMDDSNNTVLGFEGSGIPKEPAHAFKLKPSENSAFVTVKASNRKSARGLIRYEGCKV